MNTTEQKSYDWESQISAIAYLHDVTSFVVISATSLETAGAANTAVAILDVSKYKNNILYIQSTNGPAANAGTTGLTVIMESRPASAVAWTVFRTESGVVTTGASAYELVGSGATLSGVKHFGDVRITVQNTTDSSGTATISAYMMSRTP